uniref:Amidase domain-containing protein n=1 Tax=Kwoniella dejecticola CBS 10117 TaxID=1296121 RepID=A0A1A6ABK7_9TREE|nr:uncharacterized protein I303_01652 [Kwoniella dejecticola CBS 10117]OBR87447.1 hypothetical protein I303_01652 [Kwoniella dejecticola CBS 10117]
MSIPSNFLTASQTIKLVSDGRLTIEQMALDHLQRYDERQSDIGAWVYTDRKRVIQEARRLDRIPKEKRGRLHGVLLAVKDMMNMPTQHGSPIYKNSQPGVDAACVAICRAAGALIFGKTHTTEFACSNIGPEGCGNPYDTSRTPGGSSSGSAAALRDFQCSLAFGTQTGGSTMRPASYNGIFGIKPTWGAISTWGLKPYAPTLDTVGLFARSIEDLKLFLSVFEIPTSVPTALPLKPLSSCKFAYVKTDQWVDPSPELQSAWERSAGLLRQAGADVVSLDLPEEFDGISGGLAWTINKSEGRVSFKREYQTQPDQLSTYVHTEIYDEKEIPTQKITEAYDKVASLRPLIDKIASGYDAIVTPSVEGEAPVGLGWTGSPKFCAMWTSLHVPCVHIPGFAGENGMPIGLTLVGPRYDEHRLLNVAQVVAEVWARADEDRLNKIPVPEGVRHLTI